ncbi:MAG: NotI family restriction endonuclease [Planctomycetaceae bacterium]
MAKKQSRLPIDPTTIIGEILGEPASEMRSPVNAGYLCPFINSICIKRGQRNTDPYPICSIWRGKAEARKLVCVCPKRFFEVNFLRDVMEHCWIGPQPSEPKIAHEVTMKGFGKVDFVIADVDASNSVKEFISVELQAVDISGSVANSFEAVCNSEMLKQKLAHGFNWANVRKRYVSQLIAKGFFHHHWNSRIVAVLQTVVYEEFRKYIQFDELHPTQGNIVFMLYDYSAAEPFSMKLDRVVATSHGSLMTGSLYRQAPAREEYIRKIVARLPHR